ncbi:MAG: serine/threonine-protein kinase, partial [Planctomycetaceae bacterium]
MPPSPIDDLSRQLVRHQLVPQGTMDQCLLELGQRARDPEAVVSWLETKGVLTSLQCQKIRKGELQDLVLGPFRLLYQNASGSFARVYRACDTRSGKMVGLKVLRQRYNSNREAVTEFRREAELGRALRHENIVPIYDVAEDHGTHYIAMEFVEGGNLRDFIQIRRKLSPLDAVKCVLDIAEGLEYALTKGATHRDLKMTKVLMSSTGVAKLVDFGLAGAESPTQQGSEENQRALEYASLERGTNAPRNDPRSDLFFAESISHDDEAIRRLIVQPGEPAREIRQNQDPITVLAEVLPQQ